jgi:hypothetical protein
MNIKILKELQRLAEFHNMKVPFLQNGADSQGDYVLLGDYFRGEDRYAIGSNEAAQIEGIKCHRCNPNDLRDLFDDEQFSTVISGEALEHDRNFWFSLAGSGKTREFSKAAVLSVSRGYPAQEPVLGPRASADPRAGRDDLL